MSIAYDKRDFRDPSDFLDEGENGGEDVGSSAVRTDLQGGSGGSASSTRIDKLAKKLREEAKYDAVEIFDRLTSAALKDFVEECCS